ncbi:hypothetical protein K7X08_011885 [Anisodus acutangulus]|uniref:Uncharacterized protein n=1 Tax=Anisodus acutangulus TaxID=402998 RepID=A0A9Q1LC71_9SOLA|nr:hypothetical protein K7X08_011885 [Anisodus acutangulus]
MRASSSQTRNKTIATGSSQKTAVSSEPHIPLQKEINDNISKVLNRVAVGDDTQETGKTPVNVITLTGDNKGSSMQLGPDSSTKGGRIHIHRGYKINPEESGDATTDGDGSSKRRRWKDGWDSTILDPDVVKYKRNKSLTKEEIEAFWRSKKQKEEDSSVLSPRSQIHANSTSEETAKTTYEISNSGKILDMNSEENTEKHGWWASSRWAHLNERPVLPPEEASYKNLSRFKQAQTG